MARAKQGVMRPWTVEEFLEWEREQEERFEFVDGVIRMMVGGTLDHNTIAGNIMVALRQRLRGGPCRVFMEGVKVTTASSTMYPDVVVTCAPVAGKDDVVREPAVVFEVLSRSTQGFDRGAKWDAYQSIPSLGQYVLVSQDEMRVQVFDREEDSWRLRVLEGPGAVLKLLAPACDLALAEIYEGTALAQS